MEKLLSLIMAISSTAFLRPLIFIYGGGIGNTIGISTAFYVTTKKTKWPEFLQGRKDYYISPSIEEEIKKNNHLKKCSLLG